MQSVISVLPDHIANQIAAGEVIQRPASVVKELVENAIDAGAEKIQVHIKDAGKTLIQIIDDGKGMNAMDAELCFLRHATSKIHSADDLFALKTKGFRGEALASIAAIAHVTLQTRQKESETGTLVQVEGSQIVEKTEVVCNVGTSFEVKNLFFNVPARRNFLKSNEIEFRHIRDEFERIALAHPDIHFILSHNGTEVFNLRSVVLRKRIVDIIGDRQNERLVPIQEETSIVKIEGYVVKPEYAKKTRGEQFLFVNNRFFKDNYFNHAVNKAFEGLIQPKTYPGYFLYFEIDPSKIDVNVHPTKTEIKFEEDKFIYSILVSSIRQALGKYNIAPSLDFEQENSFDLPYEMKSQPVIAPTIQVNPNYNPFRSTSSSSSTKSSYASENRSINQLGFGENKATQQDWENFYKIDEVEEEVEVQQTIEHDVDEVEKVDQYIIKSPFVLFPSKTGLMLVHFKRAFERIVYDSMMKEFIINPIASQTMLFPFEREISKGEEVIWSSNSSLLSRLGFQSEIANGNLLLHAIPAVLQEETINECLDSIFENMVYSGVDKGDIAHLLISNIAMNAGKTKNITTKAGVDQLVESLFQCAEHMHTPTGKTILKTMSLSDIQQLF
ncbi:MAG TPA: DNA mismatch repair endonuclease MutL [Taishania sp.]|nr:DNA mismatch repair endonuclease MutL [Taishania sp.]